VNRTIRTPLTTAALLLCMPLTIIVSGCPKILEAEPAPSHRYTIFTWDADGDYGVFECDDARIVDGNVVATIESITNKLDNYRNHGGVGDVVTVSPPFVVYDHAQGPPLERGAPRPPNGSGRP